MFAHPARTAGDDFHSCLESFQVVAVCHLRVSKFYGDVRTLECLRVEVFLIVDVDDAYDLMSAAEGYLFDLFAHLSITD